MSDVQGPANTPIFNPPPIRGSRKIYTPGNSASSDGERDWSHGGTVNPSATEFGPAWPAPYDLTLHTLILTLIGASNVNLSVTTLINGNTVRTDVLTAGLKIATFSPGILVSAGVTIGPGLLAAPTGTGNALGIIYRYSRA